MFELPPPKPADIQPLTYECLMAESQKQQVAPLILLALFKTEGGTLGRASSNTNGSKDYGPMQINTINLKEIAQWVPPTDIRDNGCVNMGAAAYLLRKCINRHNGDLWKGVGCYHSNTPHLSAGYQQRVYNNLQRIIAGKADIRPLFSGNR